MDKAETPAWRLYKQNGKAFQRFGKGFQQNGKAFQRFDEGFQQNDIAFQRFGDGFQRFNDAFQQIDGGFQRINDDFQRFNDGFQQYCERGRRRSRSEYELKLYRFNYFGKKYLAMEQPYSSRTIINEGHNGLEIIILVQKNWYGIICILGCTVVWLLCDIALIAGFTGHLDQSHSGNEFAIYFLIWNLILFHCVRTLLWSLRGKEIITVGQGQLTIQRKGDILYRRKVYETSEVNNIRIQNGALGLKDIFKRRNTSGPFTVDGTLQFNYGLKTIKFALGMEVKEAVIIIEKMKNYGIG